MFCFDGTDDRISFSTVAIKTICFWGRLSSGFADLGALVATSNNGDGSLRVRSADGTGRFRSSPDTNDFQKGSGLKQQLMMNGEANLPSSDTNFIVPHGRTMLQDYYVGALGQNRNLSTISHSFMSRRYKGRVYAVLLYNRHLTFSELLQNYNSFKGRFNL